MNVINLGDTFLAMPSPNGTLHLTFVIAWYSLTDGTRKLVVVNASSAHGPVDRTCMLLPTDPDAHPWIKHDSFVFYAHMDLYSERELLNYKPRQPASRDLLRRIQRGALASDLTPAKYRKSINAALRSA